MKILLQNKGRTVLALFAVALAGTFISISLKDGSILTGQVTSFRKPLLAPCSRESHEDIFPSDSNRSGILNTLKSWNKTYHVKVNEIIEEHLSQAQTTASRPLQCDADSSGSLDPAGEKLKALAKQLPLWENEAELNKLSSSDMPLVLSEFLRIYECSLVEYNLFLAVEDTDSEYYSDKIVLPAWVSVINEHATLARESLEDVLGVLSGVARLRPLEMELTCLQRASLDARNGFALLAEASACMPKTWDAKDPLRDL